MKRSHLFSFLLACFVFTFHTGIAQNTTFEFSGEKSQLYHRMKPTDGKDGFDADYVFEYCFVNCGAWKTPILYFNRLGKPLTRGYYRNGKYYSTNSTDDRLNKLIQAVNYEGYIYMDIKTEIILSRVSMSSYNCVNVLQNNNTNIGCFDANVFVWFDENKKEDYRNRVKSFECKILAYKLSYSFLEGPCKYLNAYIDSLSIQSKKDSLRNQLKESLKKELNKLPESELDKRMNIRRQLATIDPADEENNTNIRILERKIAARIETEKNNQKREENKFVNDFRSEATKMNISPQANTSYQAQKSTEQIIYDGANDIISIILNARKRNEAYEAALKQKNIELAEQRTQELKNQQREYMIRLQKRAKENANDAAAWMEATKTNTMSAYADYLSKYGNDAVFYEPAKAFYLGFRTKQTQSDLDREIKWAAGWDNWNLVLYLTSLGANPNVEWYLADGTYDGNILSRLFNSEFKKDLTDFPANSRRKQIQILTYLIENNLDLNQSNFTYVLENKFDPTVDVNFSMLNAICKSNNINKHNRAILFHSTLRNAFYKSGIERYFQHVADDMATNNRAGNSKKIFSAQEVNECYTFQIKYLDSMFIKLNVDLGELIEFNRKINWQELNIFSQFFYHEPTEHLIMLRYLKEKGLNKTTLNAHPLSLSYIRNGLASFKEINGQPTATEIEILKEYFAIGVNPEVSTNTIPGSKSIYKFWLKNNYLCAQTWNEYKKNHSIK